MSNKLINYVEIKDPQLRSSIQKIVSAYEAFKVCLSCANAPMQRQDLYEKSLSQMKVHILTFIASLDTLLRLRMKMELIIHTVEEDV